MKKELGKSLNLQVHDEIVGSFPLERAWDWISYIVPIMSQPREIMGAELRVPVGITVGMTWADGDSEFKVMPTRKEFEEVVWGVYEKGG